MKNKCSYFNGFEKAKERGQKIFLNYGQISTKLDTKHGTKHCI
jgi:hypothetical protein